MSTNSKIEWTDATWNPVTGCTEVTPGCDNCYAKTLAERFRGTKGHYFENGFDVQLRPDKLVLPLTWRKPRKVFVNSMSDLFHTKVPLGFIASVFAVMAVTPQHTYQLLTKRHGRMHSLLNNRPAVFLEAVSQIREEVMPGASTTPLVWPLPNVWLGVSVEDQKRADLRVVALLGTPAAIRFVSAEPLLGPVDLSWCSGVDALRRDWAGGPTGGTGAPHPLLDWVIVGGESGRSARPMHPAWARSLRNQCERAQVPFHFKQRGEWTWDQVGTDNSEPDLYVNEATGVTADEETALAAGGSWSGMWRVGKKGAGRELDRQTWDQMPGRMA